jgi:L-ascorbate metabolism protein UlaG (beta-lactamase superfamily)
LRLRFHGHACFSIEAEDGARLCIDPYESGDFGGAVALPPLPNTFGAWIATHEHSDHNAGHTIPSAERLRAPCTWGAFSIERRSAWHDEFGGRLRGGATDLLRVTVDGCTVLHVGDLGERPTGDLLAWLIETPIDALIVPVGGYFTLGPDGAAELAALLRPRWVVPCHSADDGVRLSQLGPRAPFLARFDEPMSVRELDPRSGDGVAAFTRS